MQHNKIPNFYICFNQAKHVKRLLLLYSTDSRARVGTLLLSINY